MDLGVEGITDMASLRQTMDATRMADPDEEGMGHRAADEVAMVPLQEATEEVG
jgi:hypothetical protein